MTKNVAVNLIILWLKAHKNGYGLSIKVSVKFILDKATQVQRGSRGIIALLSASWRWVVSDIPRLLYPLERTSVPIVQEAGWAPEPVWMGLIPRLYSP